MTRTFVYSISAEESGTKITDYLRNHGYSRHILTCLKHTDDTVLVNGLGVYMNYVLQPDDRLTIDTGRNTVGTYRSCKPSFSGCL